MATFTNCSLAGNTHDVTIKHVHSEKHSDVNRRVVAVLKVAFFGIGGRNCFKLYAVFMPPPLGAGGIMFSGCPSVRLSVRPSEAWNTLFWPVHRSVGPPDQPLPFYGMSVRPSVCPSVRLSVRPERFPGICRRLHGGISLKFYMLMYLDHLQNWLVYGHGLVIFLILAVFGLSETGQIWGFRVFPGECMEYMTWNFARWCIMTTFRTD